MILSISEQDLSPDWKDKCPRWNRLEINIDCKNALCPPSIQNIKKISLFNYKIISLKMNEGTSIDISAFSNTWWLGDSLEKLSENSFLLSAECTDLRSNILLMQIKFSFAEVLRE